MKISALREITAEEKSLLDCMLAQDFPGRDEIREQLAHARAREIREDGCQGCIEFESTSRAAASVRDRVPVAASYEDSGGVPVELLLHVVDGRVSELEIWKGDGSPIRRRPMPSDLTVKVAPWDY